MLYENIKSLKETLQSENSYHNINFDILIA